MSELDWRVVTITAWPTSETERPRDHPFRIVRKATPGCVKSSKWGVDWPATTRLLGRELKHLKATRIRLQMWVQDRDIRVDGWIRGDARPWKPGVILSFESKYGPLSYPCDAFSDWRANIRGIALALEALRKVDRYGVTKRGEQYTGWKQIAAAAGEGRADPYEVIGAACGLTAEVVRANPRRARRRALASVHPDVAGGSAKAFGRVVDALEEIGAA